MPKLTLTPLTQSESAKWQLAFLQLATLLRASENIVAIALDPPRPGSAVDRAFKAKLRDPYEHAGLLLFAAEDHLRTILALFETRTLPTYSLYTLLRGAAEALVQARHLTDPSVGEDVRLGRALDWRFENLLEQHKVKSDDPSVQKAADDLFDQRSAHLVSRARASGVPIRDQPRKDGTRELVGFGDQRLSATRLFELYLGEGELVYRFLSGHAHSLPWPKVTRDGAVPTSEQGVFLMPQVLSVALFADALALVLALYERTVIDLIDLAGYPRAVWDEPKKAAMREARARLQALAEDAPTRALT